MRTVLIVMLLTPLLALAADPVPVSVKPLSELALYPRLEAPASVVSLNQSRLSAEIRAAVLEIPVKVGDPVARGDLLVRLDCRDYELNLRQARAALEAAQAQRRLAEYRLQRARALAKSSNVSEELLVQREVELTALKADIRANEAQLSMAELNVERCEVRAPFSGVVVERPGQVGELAAPGNPLIRLQDTLAIEVSAQISAAQLESLKAADSIRFQENGIGHPLKIRAVVPVRDPRARTQEVRLLFTRTVAPPGAAGRVVWRHNRPFVAPDLVVQRGGALGLFLAEEGQARFHPLPGAQEGRPAPVDLPLTAQVVVEGRINLTDGSPLRIESR
ncbi:MAG: efflux RND transporter periplasmic adaptor subunit [Gammaproteobacteria bacterium]